MTVKKRESASTGRKVGRPRKRLLQGAKLRKAALVRLEHLVTLSPKTDPISISRLAQDLGVSRPAIYNNDLKDVVRDYRERQRANFEVEAEARARRAPLEQAVPKLKTKNRELRARLDGLAQWWVYWARYALRHGIKPDLMFPDGGPEDTEWPVPPPPDVPQARRREPGRRQAARSKR